MSILESFANNWSVKRKGLLLVGVPVVFQLILMLLLNFLYSQAEQQAWAEAQSRLLMVRVNTVLSELYDAGQVLIAYAAMPTDSVYQKWLWKKQNLIDELDSLKQFSINEKDSATYGRLVDIGNNGVSLLDKCYKKARTSGSFIVIQEFPEIKRFSNSLFAEVEVVLTADLKSQVFSTVSANSLRKAIVACVYVGVAIDIAIAIGLSFFFGSSIERRLQVISDNAKRLGEHSKLSASLSGRDEIALLDASFHELSNRLLESEKLRAEFLSMISHDMRSPLMSIEFSLGQLEDQLTSDRSPETAENMRSINVNLSRLLALVEDVLELDRGSSGKLQLQLEELELVDAFRRITESLAPLAEQKNVALLADAHGQSVFADRRRIDQVLINIVQNAIKFTPPGTAISIAASRSNDTAEITISDGGEGIGPENRKFLFERYCDLSAARQGGKPSGFGLGLAICKTIVKAHHGEIGYRQNQSNKSEFWIRLRAAD